MSCLTWAMSFVLPSSTLPHVFTRELAKLSKLGCILVEERRETVDGQGRPVQNGCIRAS